MRGRAIALAAICLASCGGDPDESTVLNVESKAEANRIADLSELDKGEEAAILVPPDPIPLQPLTFDEADRELAAGAGCDLILGDRLLLVAVEGDAIAKVGGRIVHLTTDSLTPSGGFFKSDAVTISIGITSDRAVVEGETARWPADVAIRKTGAEKPTQVKASWRCGA